MMTAMTLDKIKTETTWNDASASINSNFAKILQALGGSIPEGVDSTLIRILYFADESVGDTLTEEQKAYNAETFTMLSQSKELMVVVGGFPLVLGLLENDFAFFTLRSEVIGFIVRADIILNSDGTVELPEDSQGAVPPLVYLDNTFTAPMYWMCREVIPEAKGAFLVDGVVYEVDSWGIKDNIPQVEYNEGSKRYRVFFDPDKAYAITGKIDITPAGGGGSIDPELLEGYLPMMREFSDDFNNDFTR